MKFLRVRVDAQRTDAQPNMPTFMAVNLKTGNTQKGLVFYLHLTAIDVQKFIGRNVTELANLTFL